MKEQIHKYVYLRGKDETDKIAAARDKKIKSYAKKWDCTQSATITRMIDAYVE